MIVDDLLHDGRIRRGVPSAHCVFGKARAITASHFSYLSLLEVKTSLKLTKCKINP